MPILLVGLGNPGAKYARTRHNAGWMLLDQLAGEEGVAFKPSTLVQGEVAETTIGDTPVTLLKPLTFMNLSGEAAQPLMRALDLSLEDVLVLVDEIQLPTGKLKLSTEGSDGGHNGLKSLDLCFGSNAYRRLRIGVGPHPPGEMRDFVLSDFRADEADLLKATLALGIDAIRRWAQECGTGAESAKAFLKAMGEANQKKRQPLEIELEERRQRAARVEERRQRAARVEERRQRAARVEEDQSAPEVEERAEAAPTEAKSGLIGNLIRRFTKPKEAKRGDNDSETEEN